jgi:hypothetical protein
MDAVGGLVARRRGTSIEGVLLLLAVVVKARACTGGAVIAAGRRLRRGEFDEEARAQPEGELALGVLGVRGRALEILAQQLSPLLE